MYLLPISKLLRVFSVTRSDDGIKVPNSGQIGYWIQRYAESWETDKHTQVHLIMSSVSSDYQTLTVYHRRMGSNYCSLGVWGRVPDPYHYYQSPQVKRFDIICRGSMGSKAWRSNNNILVHLEHSKNRFTRFKIMAELGRAKTSRGDHSRTNRYLQKKVDLKGRVVPFFIQGQSEVTYFYF